MIGLQVPAGRIEDIPPGEGREFAIAGQRIAVFRMRSGEVYAISAVCPHRDGPLADGLTGGATVICPFHGRKFDLITGEASEGCGVQTYPVHLEENGVIMITLPAAGSELSLR